MRLSKMKYVIAAVILLVPVLLCRPTVYKKTWFGKKKVWGYPGSGFMETVHFNVEWLSEKEIKVIYEDVKYKEYNEEYIISIPE